MTCTGNIPLLHHDSEREEGEIVDELDDLSDISSEEEYLLRQRLQVLENYNNVLERKEAKRTNTGYRDILENDIDQCDLSDISNTNFEDECFMKRCVQEKRPKLTHHKHKRRKESVSGNQVAKTKERKKKIHKTKKKIQESSESSDESDLDFKSKRIKLANAVQVKKDKTDTSLKARLMKMLYNTNTGSRENSNIIKTDNKIIVTSIIETKDKKKNSVPNENIKLNNEIKDKTVLLEIPNVVVQESIELSTDDDIQITACDYATISSADMVDGIIVKNNLNKVKSEEGSDEDLELLRQHALESKTPKTQPNNDVPEEDCKLMSQSEDEDSDTAELRLICLRSALLKKAIEMKQKQKLRKRLSQSSTMFDESIPNVDVVPKMDADNNTDIESVDMDMGSDAPDHSEDVIKEYDKINTNDKEDTPITKLDKTKCLDVDDVPYKENVAPKEDELEEDEDLLRAKLLTSLSKNLPLLVDPSKLEDDLEKQSTKNHHKISTVDSEKNKTVRDEKKLPEPKRFIINTGGSDSEDETEATKNLTKMHMKLSEQVDFQQKLDVFLKSARKAVENTKLPDVVQQQPLLGLPEPPVKFVPKVVNHLPKTEQQEYKSLVKRMAELEKIKQVRQNTVNAWKNSNMQQTIQNNKETLKPRNVTIETINISQNFMDEQIALSRKKIAAESAKVLQLKEEETKLSQKYKIVATELRNLSTAIIFNKKQQKSSQIKLSKIRAQHQMLLKRTTMNQSKRIILTSSNSQPPSKQVTKLQKENDPSIEKLNRPNHIETVKISVNNDLLDKNMNTETTEPTLSVQIDITNNRKTVKVAGEINVKSAIINTNNPTVEKGGRTKDVLTENVDDYQSPLKALESIGWDQDPNGVLCPFEMGGSCKDGNCKYLHPKPLTSIH